MATKKARTPKKPQTLPFSNKLVLNLWLISLFGVDVFADSRDAGKPVRPMVWLSKTLRNTKEGLNEQGLHHFYTEVLAHWQPTALLQKEALLQYEENISEHTRILNEKRGAQGRAIEWKYYQWLSLLFTEVYLHQYFSNRDALLAQLNAFVNQFNTHWEAKNTPTGITSYTMAELNKVCLQNATGSGKTLLMHMNFMQFAHYASAHGGTDDFDRALLITPNEGLSSQHEVELNMSGVKVERLVLDNNDMFRSQKGHLGQVNFIEITKLKDVDGPNTIATRNLGDKNVILVDEGHRGFGKSEETGWYKQREMLTRNGFAFEYSATFKEAVKAADNEVIEQAYAKAVLFDYSYKYFYADGYGKDYRIFNLPKPDNSQAGNAQETQEFVYLTACLLSFYQQLRLYRERKMDFVAYNIEKPLWVFVGASVSASVSTKDEKETVTDIAKVLHYFAQFLAEPVRAQKVIELLLNKSAKDTGLLDGQGHDIFSGAFGFLREQTIKGQSINDIHADILEILFNNRAGGALHMVRIKGDSGELVLKAGSTDKHFGLINVGDAKGLAEHITLQSKAEHFSTIAVTDSDFLAPQFASVKDSDSPITLLIGARKFIEGWDCWRVSTLGLMRVGKSEGSQIIQLFGRGVRLKGYDWSLKRSNYATPTHAPAHIRYLETLNVFGIEASFMEKFREYLADEGVPLNDAKHSITIPMNVTYDFGHKLKVLRPKRKDGAGREYIFNRDGIMPVLNGDVPDYLTQNKVVLDWYPKIQAIVAQGVAFGSQATTKEKTTLTAQHLAFINVDALYFALEQFKARENLYSLIISPQGIRQLLSQSGWYELFAPADVMRLSNFDNVRVWQQMALALLKSYAKKLFAYHADAFIRPRLEVRILDHEDDNIPKNDEAYTLTVEASETHLIQDIEKLQNDIAQANKKQNQLIEVGNLKACILGQHLYEPLLYNPKDSGITIAPVALNDSEKDFVCDLKDWLQLPANQEKLAGAQIYLLRNRTRGSGVGFFEAGNFYPDFLLWLVKPNQQTLVFIEPHGIKHEGINHPKIMFHQTIKDVEQRLAGKQLKLESFVLTPTSFQSIAVQGWKKEDWQARNVVFMQDNQYLSQLMGKLL